LRSGEQTVAQLGELGVQRSGRLACQRRGIDLGGQQHRRGYIGAAAKTIPFGSSRQIKEFRAASANAAA